MWNLARDPEHYDAIVAVMELRETLRDYVAEVNNQTVMSGVPMMVSQRQPSPLFLGRFPPVLRRFSAVILCCLASWRRDGENGRKMAENGRNLGEKRARNSGG